MHSNHEKSQLWAKCILSSRKYCTLKIEELNAASSLFTGFETCILKTESFWLSCSTLEDHSLLPCEAEEGKGWEREEQTRRSLKGISSPWALRLWFHVS